MKTIRTSASCLLLTTAVLCALALLAVPILAAPPQYIVTDLGTHSSGNGINASGQVVGIYYGYAARWTGAAWSNLGSLGTITDPTYGTFPTGSIGYAINDAGQVAGYSYLTGAYQLPQAVRWTGTTPTDLSTPSVESYGYGINASGQVVGSTGFGRGVHAVRWTGATPTDLGVGVGFGINDAGQVAGHSPTGSAIHAVRWTGTTPTDLGTLGGTTSYGYDINASGQVVGSAQIANGQYHAVRWTGTTPTDIGTFAPLGSTANSCRSINASGQIVGTCAFPSGGGVFLFTGETMYDLLTLVVPGSGASGLSLGGGYHVINDSGQIVVNGTIAGQNHVLLLTPSAPLTVQANFTDDGTVNGSGNFPIDSLQQISATPTPGYIFTHWNDGNTDNPRTVIDPAGGVSYTAIFHAPPPTPETLARLSKRVYQDGAGSALGTEAYLYQGDNAQYIPLDIFTDTGFRAAVYATSDYTQVVIAFRGTDPGGLSVTKLLNLAADVGFAASQPSPTLVKYTTAAAHMLLTIHDGPLFKDADITVTGHSLGGALAQLTGTAGGFQTYAFNAPQAGAIYSTLHNSTDLRLLQGKGPGGTDTNYRIYGDQISLFGTLMPNSNTVTLPWPIDPGWVYVPGNPASEVSKNLDKIFYLHSIDSIIAQINAQPVLPSGQPNVPLAIETSAVWINVGAGLYSILFNLGSVLDWLFDPAGADFIFEEQAGSPEFASIVLPSLTEVAWYDLRFEVGGVWSSFSFLQPGSDYQFGLGVTGLEFIPMDANGNAVSLPDFLFALSFVTTGTVAAQLATHDSAPPLPPFQLWQIAKFGANSAISAISGETANPSHDGVANLVKYALGMNPNVNSLIGLPVVGIANVSGTNYLTLTFNKNDAATDITYHPEASNDLSNWSSSGLAEQILSDNGTVRQIQDSIPFDSSQPMFIRLRVTRP